MFPFTMSNFGHSKLTKCHSPNETKFPCEMYVVGKLNISGKTEIDRRIKTCNQYCFIFCVFFLILVWFYMTTNLKNLLNKTNIERKWCNKETKEMRQIKYRKMLIFGSIIITQTTNTCLNRIKLIP